MLFILWNWGGNDEDDVSFFHLHTVLPVIYFTGWRQRKNVKRESVKSDHKDDDSSLLPLSQRSTLFILRNGGIGRTWSEQKRKEIIRMTLPDFCHCHSVLPVFYLMEWRQRKDVKRAREKRDQRMIFSDFCQCHSVLPVIYFTVWRQRKDVKRESKKSYHKDDDSSLFATFTPFYLLRRK